MYEGPGTVLDFVLYLLLYHTNGGKECVSLIHSTTYDSSWVRILRDHPDIHFLWQHSTNCCFCCTTVRCTKREIIPPVFPCFLFSNLIFQIKTAFLAFFESLTNDHLKPQNATFDSFSNLRRGLKCFELFTSLTLFFFQRVQIAHYQQKTRHKSYLVFWRFKRTAAVWKAGVLFDACHPLKPTHRISFFTLYNTNHEDRTHRRSCCDLVRVYQCFLHLPRWHGWRKTAKVCPSCS